MLRRNHGETEASSFEPLACAILDVDHFKRVNDTYGHSAGDAVLSGLGALFRRPALLRKTDIVGRYGGEEFAFVMPSCTEQSACIPLGRLWSAIQDMKIESPPNTEIRITVSIGISQATSQDKGVFDVLSRADKALYYAKNHGRNRIVGYEQCCEALACVPPHALTN